VFIHGRLSWSFFLIIDPDKKDCSLPSKEEADEARPEKNQERPESSDFVYNSDSESVSEFSSEETIAVEWTTVRIPGEIGSVSLSRVDLIFADNAESKSAKSKQEKEKADAFQIRLAANMEISNALKKSFDENEAKELKRIRDAMEVDEAIRRSKLNTTMNEVARQLEKFSKRTKFASKIVLFPRTHPTIR